KETVGNSRIWEVHLTLTDTNDPELAALTCRIREELCGSTPLQRLGHLMITVGDFNQAEEICNRLLENICSDDDRIHIYHQLGLLSAGQDQYTDAATFYEKSLEIKQKTLPEDHLSLATSYNNLGGVYQKKGEYLKAHEFYEKALHIKMKTVDANDLACATSYNNIGSVYYDMADYSKTIELYNKALQIFETHLPRNHPS
ncbi:unnamed protein product, partial [Rotaria socialis]